MQLTVLTALALAATASCSSCHRWIPPKLLDRRGPCPMLNSLANHGFLARHGLNISVDDIVNAFEESVNLSRDLTLDVAQLAVTTSTTGNPNTLNMDDLNTPGIMEHDGSLSRNDYYFGDNHSFNSTIFDTVAAHFGPDTISIEQAAAARSDRVKAARAANPDFELSDSGENFSFLETALYLRLFGHGTEGNANTEWVEILFREERLPFREGFKRSQAVLTGEEIDELAQKVADATA